MNTSTQKELLYKEYVMNKRSSAEIAKVLNLSASGVNYLIKKYGIPKRTISEAVYQKWNPNGNPFKIKKIKSAQDHFLAGLGIGLYWGEGTKRSLNSVRLANTDPDLVKLFVKYLCDICGVKKEKIHFYLQLFADLNEKKIKNFWMKKLSLKNDKQFYKTIITPSIKKGSYKTKVQHGVMFVCFNNTKLRNHLNQTIDSLREK